MAGPRIPSEQTDNYDSDGRSSTRPSDLFTRVHAENGTSATTRPSVTDDRGRSFETRPDGSIIVTPLNFEHGNGYPQGRASGGAGAAGDDGAYSYDGGSGTGRGSGGSGNVRDVVDPNSDVNPRTGGGFNSPPDDRGAYSYDGEGPVGAPGATGGRGRPYRPDQTYNSDDGGAGGAAYANARTGRGPKGGDISDEEYYTRVPRGNGTEQPLNYATHETSPLNHQAQNLVMQGWAMANHSDASKPAEYNKLNRSMDGHVGVGPWALDGQDCAQVFQDGSGNLNQQKISQLVQSGELMPETARLIQTPEFAQFQNDLADGKSLSPQQIAHFMPPDLQATVARDIATNMGNAQSQVIQFDAGAIVAAIKQGRPLSQQELGDPTNNAFARTIDQQLLSYADAAQNPQRGNGNGSDQSQNPPGASGNGSDQSQQSTNVDGNGQPFQGTGTNDVMAQSAIPGRTVGDMFRSHRVWGVDMGTVDPTAPSNAPGDTIGDLYGVGDSGISAIRTDVPTGIAETQEARSGKQNK